MAWDTFIPTAIAIASTVAAPIVYAYRNLLHRIEKLEQSNQTKMSEQEVRQLLDDKLEAVKESLEDVKISIDKLTTYILALKHN